MMNKLLNKICIGAMLCCAVHQLFLVIAAGLTYERGTESVYSEVGKQNQVKSPGIV